MSASPRRSVALLLLCLFLSGAVALVYEIVWIRKAALAFGSTNLALSTVLATFFGGLALGGEVFGRLSLRLARPLRTYAVLEIATGVLAALSPLAFLLAEALYGGVYGRLNDDFLLLSLARVPFVAMLVLPPAFLLGGTLPLVVRVLVVEHRHLGLGIGGLYALNTLGAAIGCVLAGTLLVPTIGLDAALWLGAAIHGLIGVVAWRLRVPDPPPVPESPPSAAAAPASTAAHAPASAPATRPAVLLTLVFLTGFVALGGEVLWTRFLSLLVRNTVHTYTLTLTVVLVGIVIGSAITSLWLDRVRSRAAVFGLVQVLTGLGVLGVLLLPPAFWRGSFDASTAAGRLGITALVLLGPAVLMGISFPLAVRLLVDQPGRAGFGIGRITLVNTAGGILGSLGVGFLAIPALGLSGSMALTTGLSVGAGCGAWLLLTPGRPRALHVVGATLAVGAWLALPHLADVRLPADHLASRERLVDFREGIAAHVAVVQKGTVTTLEIDRLWQGEERKNHQILAAHVPMLLHDDPRRVLVIGFGTGQAPRRFLMYDELEQLSCVDIEGSLFEIAREHFDGGWLDDPRVHARAEDGRSAVSHGTQEWDVVSIEVGQTFRPGVASFYTVDFYRRAAERLAPGGLVSQFVPIGFLDTGEFRSVLASFRAVFPTCVLWFNGAELLLVGRAPGDGPREGGFGWDGARLALLDDDGDVHDDLAYSYWGAQESALNQAPVFLGGFLAGPGAVAALADGAPVYTDDVPVLDYTAADGATEQEEAAIVALIRRHLDPLDALLDAAAPSELATAAAAARDRNLADLPSRALSRQAFDLQAVGRYEESIPLLEEALRLNVRSVRSLNLLAYAYTRTGRDRDALPFYEAAAALAPDDGAIRRNVGIQLMKAGDPMGALVEFEAALALGTDDAEVRMGLGASMAMRRRPDEAIEHFRAALDHEPDHGTARLNLAVALVNAGRLDEGVAEYERLAADDPDDAAVRYNLGIALARAGRTEAAIASYTAAIALRPDMAEAHANLGNLLSGQGDPEGAIEHYGRALETQPNQLTARVNRATLLERLQRLDEALVDSTHALGLDPRSADVHNLHGRILYGLERVDEAVASFETALKRDAAHAAAAANLAAALSGAPLPPP